MEAQCPFCNLPKERVWFDSQDSLAILDGFPLTPGHTLVIPKRHVVSVFELPQEELNHLSVVVTKVRKILKAKYQPDAFNIGINDGLAAGQTVTHAHIHVIPRKAGDVPDPRGGIRWIIPDKAKYW
jgi:diadenosine tetraphosphate (Ap4A) HIT family hydrolase